MVLGKPEMSTKVTNASQDQGHAAATATTLERVARLVEWMESKAAGSGQNSNSSDSTTAQTATTTNGYSSYDQAAIKGWASITDDKDIPKIWALWAASKNVIDHRLNMKKSMQLWSETLGYEIDEGVFFLKDTMDNLVKVHSTHGTGRVCCQPPHSRERG